MYAILKLFRNRFFKISEEAGSTHMSVIKFLLNKGIDQNHKDNYELSSLDYAYDTDNEEVINLINANSKK